MISAINSIPGTTMVSAKQEKTMVSGTATKMCFEFLKPLLAGAGGDTDVLTTYLKTQMDSVQESSKKTNKT
jgi:hypothetical protein